jgi:hypothetical protein
MHRIAIAFGNAVFQDKVEIQHPLIPPTPFSSARGGEEGEKSGVLAHYFRI